MGRGYVARNYGDNCFYRDSSRKQYFRASRSHDIMVFNNYYGGGGCYPCCGPTVRGFGGGFGLAFGQWLMGGFNTISHYMMNPWTSFWNSSSAGASSGNSSQTCCGSSCSCQSSSESRRGLKTVDDDKSKLEDKDYGEFNDLATLILAADWPLSEEKTKEFEEKLKLLSDSDKVNAEENAVHKKNIETLIEKAAGVKQAADPNAVSDAELKVGDKLIKDLTIDGIGSITADEYNELDDAGKKAVKDKLAELLSDATEEQKTPLAKNEKIPEDLRKMVKESFYGDYTNWNGTDDLTGITLQEAEDTSGTQRKVVAAVGANATITKDNSNKYTIKITDKDTNTVVTYTQKELKDGEYIFESNGTHGEVNNEQYVLQVKNGTYILRQYSWHRGYNDPDIEGKKNQATT